MGDDVRKIQERLKSLGLYGGPVDGEFGRIALAAVKAFQRSRGLEADGIVGPLTRKALFGGSAPGSDIRSKPMDYKCLALTGAFETGRGLPDCFAGLCGDFDGQGISFGVLQWNFGQGSLQPLLREMAERHPEIVGGIFRDNRDPLSAALDAGREEQMAFARAIQDPVRHLLLEPWRGMFQALGRTEAFQEIERKSARRIFREALRSCGDYGLASERAVALMFDIRVQNGSIRESVRSRILSDFEGIPADLPEPEREVRRMQIVANRRAEAANPAWVEDVRARKLCIANGGGTVHGIPYDLEGQFGIGLARYGGLDG